MNAQGPVGINASGEFREQVMRRQIIEALTYPRILLLANLGDDECPQNRYFNPAHPSCQHCDQGEECHWLECNDEFSVLALKPMGALYESLLFSIDYVDTQCSRANHNVRRCACESCHWVRKARRLAREYRNRTPQTTASALRRFL
jgi:hypothetical protein